MSGKCTTQKYIIAALVVIIIILLAYVQFKKYYIHSLDSKKPQKIYIELKDKRGTKENYDDYMSLGF